ncbi:hypothetical protein Ddye_000844 [Dipteronia dyeriana]|uniref:SWIM-type domain-containing protein n=1 Tax=Dipteronia dyeriana TaxID=168575 RepID=A0AAD9XN38_9ROSI|nr:hypothetical protein Ddye_000844 [Dipteronia dyeriana]
MYICNTNSKHRPQLQTGVGCKAHFSVSLDRDTNKYIVRAFEENHCHKLSMFREVAWEDMYNRIDTKRRDKAFESDSHAALTFLKSKVNSETNFYYRFSTYEKDRLAKIFGGTHISYSNTSASEMFLLFTEFPDKKRKVVYHLDRVGIQEVDEDGVWDSKKHNQPFISCDCKLFQDEGIPCHHLFYVMKVEHHRKIPESMIFKRWTKSAAHDVLMKLQPDDEFSKGIDIYRFVSLSTKCNYLSQREPN